MRKEPYNPIKGKNLDIYWFLGVLLFVLGWVSFFTAKTPNIIQEPYWASTLRDGLIGFWLLLVFMVRIKAVRKIKSIVRFIFWWLDTVFCMGIMLLFSFGPSQGLITPGMIALTKTQTIEVKVQMTAKQYDGSNYYVDLVLDEELGGKQTFSITKKLFKQLYEGDWAIVSLQQSDNGLLYYMAIRH